MPNNKNEDAFVKAYNNFDKRPLSHNWGQEFYVDDFTKNTVNEIITTIRITERFQKMLVIGHRGCGKSTILNKIAQELQHNYHVVAFSAADVINMMDVESVDILLAAYLQVLQSVEKQGKFDNLRQSFKKFMTFSQSRFKPEEINLWGIVLKFKVEPESRTVIREGLRNQMDTLQKNISEACEQIRKENQKDVLIIIDDLDKLETQFAERVFYANSDLPLLPDAKIVYTFPLDTYYCSDFMNIGDRYEDQFISIVNLQTVEGEHLEFSQQALTKLILQRIEPALITEDAIKYVINMSGGVLRDLVKFMRRACKFAIVNDLSVIEQNVVDVAITDHINDYYRVFDFPKYIEKVQYIAKTKKTLDNETLVYLLRYLFVLEYRYNQKLWYDVHPCLNKAIAIESNTNE